MLHDASRAPIAAGKGPPTGLAHRCFWAYVAAFGAAWGAVEITLGSFLHTLRLPLSGTVLASLGGVILVAERQLLPARGATLATGLVAALCKSLSPGGAILGPMIGITVEAALVELALFPAPTSLPGAALGGGLAAFWATGQKAISTYIVYGGDVVRLLAAAVRKSASWVKVPETGGWLALGGLLLVPVGIGLAAGLLGWRLGRDAAEILRRERGRA